MIPNNATYISSDEAEYRYPALGDPKPTAGTKVLVLTKGGLCIATAWLDIPFFVAWAPVPKRNKTKESEIARSHPQGYQSHQSPPPRSHRDDG
ncbi:MAG: hypothetical protein EON92_13055 [Burkholderiales bacterium]|nr:MAG: hypothetical protein EON92_13055 [Burkholderiales bacterium]